MHALKDKSWTNAMEKEMENHQIIDTWDLVPPSPDIKLLGCGWVHKTKLLADGSLDKLKSRLVARGNEQEEEIDYLETFSLVVSVATTRTVLQRNRVDEATSGFRRSSKPSLHLQVKEGNLRT